MRKLKPDTRSIYTNGTEIRIELPVGDYSTFQLMTDPLTNITQSSGLSIEVINVDGGVVDVYWTTESPSVSLDCSAAKQLCSAGGQNGDCSTVVSPCDEPLVRHYVIELFFLHFSVCSENCQINDDECTLCRDCQ